jgi:hypothetical protein
MKYAVEMGSGVILYVGVLISLWLFLFHLRMVCRTNKRIFLGWVKEVTTTQS